MILLLVSDARGLRNGGPGYQQIEREGTGTRGNDKLFTRGLVEGVNAEELEF